MCPKNAKDLKSDLDTREVPEKSGSTEPCWYEGVNFETMFGRVLWVMNTSTWGIPLK